MTTGAKERENSLEAACLFCRIAGGEIPTPLVHEDERCVAFRDIHPQAPIHILIIPRRHVASLEHVPGEDQALLGHLLLTAADLARREGAHDGGYRVVLNTGRNGGQTVDHLHLHLLAGRHLGWPPG